MSDRENLNMLPDTPEEHVDQDPHGGTVSAGDESMEPMGDADTGQRGKRPPRR